MRKFVKDTSRTLIQRRNSVFYQSARMFTTEADRLGYALPLGTDNFRKAVEDELDIVDKSLFIQEILDDKATEVRVFTRPRRFAKTFNMSMLHHFLAPEVDGKPTKHLFNGLAISSLGETYTAHQGRYPVIFMSFKDIKDVDSGAAVQEFAKLISSVYFEHEYILDSDKISDYRKRDFETILRQEANEANLRTSLKELSHFLASHHGQSPWILVDEYDTPMQSAYAMGMESKETEPKEYQKVTSFFSNVLGSALKTNPHFHRAVMTGILQISKESLFSTLNNVQVFSMLDKEYSQHFGFTETEVAEVLQRAGISDKADSVRRWFNGYNIGGTVIYNPYSIASCVYKKGQIAPYWVNTSDNKLLKNLIQKSPLSVKKHLEHLVRRETITSVIDNKMVFQYLTNRPTAIWSLMLFTGYLKSESSELTSDGMLCKLSVPNLEVNALLRNIIKDWLANGLGYEWYNDFLNALLTGQKEELQSKLTTIMLQMASFHDFAREPEAFYHGIFLGLTASLHETHEVKSNRESGTGRYDIMLIPRNSQSHGVVLEFKNSKTTNIDELAVNALNQIVDNQYDEELKQKNIHQVHRIGIGFRGKECAVALETVDYEMEDHPFSGPK